MSNYCQLFYHLIWSTKNRQPLIDVTAEKILLMTIPAQIKKLGGRCHAVGMVIDHIHIAISIPSTLAIATIVKKIKGPTSYYINKNPLTGEFRWHSGYAALSFQKNILPYIVAYIKQQKKRHRCYQLVNELEHHYNIGNHASAGINSRALK